MCHHRNALLNITMSGKRYGNRKKLKTVKPANDSLIESDEYFGFIAGYTANGVPYGLLHTEMVEQGDDTKNEKTEIDNIELPF